MLNVKKQGDFICQLKENDQIVPFSGNTVVLASLLCEYQYGETVKN